MEAEKNPSSGDSSDLDRRNREASMWSNADSYVGSRSTSVSERMQFTIHPTLKPDLNRNAFKDQKYCSVCEIQVAKHGITHAKKFSCKFCYNAVCGNCSPLTLAHPESKRPERVCMNCYHGFIEEKLRSIGAEELTARLEAEIQDKNMETAKRKLAEMKCNQLDEDIKSKEEIMRKLKEDLDKERRLSSVLNSMPKMDATVNNSEDLESLQKKLKTLQNENAELKKKIESLAMLQASQRSGSCCVIQLFNLISIN